MQAWLRKLNAMSPQGLAVLRVMMGLIFLTAGYSKVTQGGFAVGAFRNLGIPLPELFGPLVSLLELLGGAALVLGLFTRILGAVFAVEFVVAVLIIVNTRGLTGAYLEYMLLVGAIVLATHGSGAAALDRPGRPWEI